MYTIDVKSDTPARGGPLPGIEVTTEMTQESASHEVEEGKQKTRSVLEA